MCRNFHVIKEYYINRVIDKNKVIFIYMIFLYLNCEEKKYNMG